MDGCFSHKKGLWGAISGGVFLIGLGLLWYYNWWWPRILFLIGALIIMGGIIGYLKG